MACLSKFFIVRSIVRYIEKYREEKRRKKSSVDTLDKEMTHASDETEPGHTRFHHAIQNDVHFKT